MGNQGSMDREDGPDFADAKADNIIRGPYMSLCSFCRAPTHNRLGIFEALRIKFYASFSFSIGIPCTGLVVSFA